MKINKYKTS